MAFFREKRLCLVEDMLKDSVYIASLSEQINTAMTEATAAHQKVNGAFDLILMIDYQTR